MLDEGNCTLESGALIWLTPINRWDEQSYQQARCQCCEMLLTLGVYYCSGPLKN